MSWLAIVCLAAGTFALKAAGPLLLGAREMPPLTARVLALLPPALLAALAALQTFQGEGGLTLDARAAGLGAAVVALALRAPFIAVVGVAMLTTALLR